MCLNVRFWSHDFGHTQLTEMVKMPNKKREVILGFEPWTSRLPRRRDTTVPTSLSAEMCKLESQ